MRYRVLPAWIELAALLGSLAACSQNVAPATTPFSGTYRGAGADETPVVLEVHQDEHFAFGQGSRGGDAFALAVLGAWGGPTLLRYLEGPPAEASFERSYSGIDLGLESGAPVALVRQAPSSSTCGGPYAGRFATGGPLPFELKLWQWGEMIAGHGKFAGRPVALAGYAYSGQPARLGMLLPDLTRFDIEIELRPATKRLRVRNLGTSMVLKQHQEGCP